LGGGAAGKVNRKSGRINNGWGKVKRAIRNYGASLKSQEGKHANQESVQDDPPRDIRFPVSSLTHPQPKQPTNRAKQPNNLTKKTTPKKRKHGKNPKEKPHHPKTTHNRQTAQKHALNNINHTTGQANTRAQLEKSGKKKFSGGFWGWGQRARLSSYQREVEVRLANRR